MRVSGITLSIRKRLILDSLSFDISRTALIGPNGSGKTMTLSVIAGLVQPDRGKISNRQSIGVMIQNGFFDPEKRVIEEMGLIKELKGGDENLTKILEKYKIQGDMKIKYLPNGKYKILRVLSAMVGNPDAVLLDEPFAGLDLISRRVIEEILKKYKGKVLITSHMLSEIRNICTDVVFINEGRVIKKKKVKQIKNLDRFYVKLYSKLT